ncbi:MAG: undecaprenyl-diphosphate phosphatase [Patescibacteria group bacterium]|jgi:undecaprenyl-diphosphatase
MNYLYAVILGVVEGLTEFLPISSTAHLIIATKILGLPQSEYWKFFEIFIQAGAILAVALAFTKTLTDKKMLINLGFSFVPTAIVGFVLYKVIKGYFLGNMVLLSLALILFGVVFLLLERKIQKGEIKLHRKNKDMNFVDATILGLCQALAVIPGVSRAGIVMVGGMLRGFERVEIALFSFMLAVPTILSAAAFDALKTDRSVITQNLSVSIVGFVSAFISAYFVVRWLIGFLQRKDLTGFAWYRIAVGILVLLFFSRV